MRPEANMGTGQGPGGADGAGDGPGPACPDERLEALVRGTLRGADADALEAHVAGCAVCADEQRWLVAERAAFAERAAAAPPPPAAVWAAIAARTQQAPAPSAAAPRRRSSARFWAFGAAGALAAAAALVLVLAGRSPSGDPGRVAQGELDAAAPGLAAAGAGPGNDDADAGAAPGPDAPQPAKGARAVAALDAADLQLDSAIAELTQEYQRRRTTLPPARVRKYDSDFHSALAVVEKARQGAGQDVSARRRLVHARSHYLRSIQTVVLKEGS